MHHVTTLIEDLSCPTCGVPGRLVVAIATARPADGCTPKYGGALGDGLHVGTVSECGRCWHRRASAIHEARMRLHAMGILRQGQPCGATWMGARTDAAEFDPVEDAVASELLRRGFGPARADVVIRVTNGLRDIRVAETELQPA